MDRDYLVERNLHSWGDTRVKERIVDRGFN